MDLKEIKDKSKKMLSNFVDEIGLDGEFYASTCNNCPVTWSNMDAVGEFITPESMRMEEILKNAKYDEKIKKLISQRGIILINKDYKQLEPDVDLFVTVMHEIIHSNRNLLLYDAIRDGSNLKAYSFKNDKFEQNSDEYGFSQGDASQEVLKGNIDTSKGTMYSYKDTISEELDDVKFTEKKGSQMINQGKVDECLVELMSILSYKLYRNKEKGKIQDIWSVIDEIKDICDGNDIGGMCKIILKHHDLELFKWMIDPISYSQGDIHYDYFGQYTKEDELLLKEIYEYNEDDEHNEDNEFNMNSFSEFKEEAKISMEDIKEVATSQTAMEELLNINKLIKNFQNFEKEENRR